MINVSCMLFIFGVYNMWLYVWFFLRRRVVFRELYIVDNVIYLIKDFFGLFNGKNEFSITFNVSWVTNKIALVLFDVGSSIYRNVRCRLKYFSNCLESKTHFELMTVFKNEQVIATHTRSAHTYGRSNPL